jgi:hypothetical protein
MNFKDAKSLIELDNDALYNALCRGVRETQDISHLKDLYKDTTTIHYKLFDDPIFTKKKNITEENPDGNNLLEYILPSVTRAYSKFFINPPSIFLNSNYLIRLELFQLQFNLNEFLDVLSTKFKSNHECLRDFKNLDTDSEILTLIVEDYVASKVSYVTSVKNSDIQKEIRDIKISRQLEI